MLFAVLAFGYINIFFYGSIVFFVFILVAGGWFTGYWNFSKKKASEYNNKIEAREKRKETLKLNSADKARLMSIDKQIDQEPTFLKGILDFHVDGKKV